MGRVSAHCSSRLAPLIEYGFMAMARILSLRVEPLLLIAARSCPLVGTSATRMSSLKSRGALPLGNLDGGAERRLRLSLPAVRRAGQQLAMQPMQLGAVESLAGGFGH